MISSKSQIYAQALFECSSEEETGNQLKALSQIFAEKELWSFFLSQSVPVEDKKKIVEEAVKQHSSPLLKNLFFVLLDNQTFFLLPQIVQSYQNFMDKRDKICRGTVYSPKGLQELEKTKLEQILQQAFNKKFLLSQKQNQNLIAGVFIETADYIFNGTVENSLKHFKNLGS